MDSKKDWEDNNEDDFNPLILNEQGEEDLEADDVDNLEDDSLDNDDDDDDDDDEEETF